MTARNDSLWNADLSPTGATQLALVALRRAVSGHGAGLNEQGMSAARRC